MSSVMLSTDVLDELNAADVRGPMSIRRFVPAGARGALAQGVPGMGAGLKGAVRMMSGMFASAVTASTLRGARRWPFSAVPAAPSAPLDAPHDLPDESPAQAAHVPGASMAGVSSAAFAAMLAAEPALRQQWRRRQVLDVALVLTWGVMIPAVMWVGTAVGF